MSTQGDRVWLCALVALLAAGLVAYSQTQIVDWDEGFHLIAASLIVSGKRPYIDFCFPQPALNALWNALWLRIADGGWRVPHAAAALLTSSAIAMTGGWVYQRMGAAAATLAILLFGLNPVVWTYGTKAQAYGAGLFLVVVAFRAAASNRWLLAGLCAGAAASCTLLTAPVALVVLVCALRNRSWNCIFGLAIGTVPILLPLALAPTATWFNLAGYQLFFRRAGLDWVAENDRDVLTAWMYSAPALILGGFAIAGARRSRRSSNAWLAIWMAALLAVEAALARPTFRQYFVFMVPLLAMLAPAALATWRRVAIGGIGVVLALSLMASLREAREDNIGWDGFAALARKVSEVTPAGAGFLADPQIYFLLHVTPPEGEAFPASHKLALDPVLDRRFHIVSQPVRDAQIRAGRFAAVETCDEEWANSIALNRIFQQRFESGGCAVYWGR